MKKLLSVLLALVMVFSLTVPAFADGPDGPAPTEWDQLCAEKPEETAQFLAEFDTWFAEQYPFLTFEEYCKLLDESPEEAYPYFFEEWSFDPVQEWADLCAEKPEQTAQFLAELDTWFAEEYRYYDSFEEYCETWEESKEEAYLELFEEWSFDPVQAWADLCAEQPQQTAQFLAEFDTWFAERLYDYDSFEEYCEYWEESTEEAYLGLFAEWTWQKEWAQKMQAERDEFLTAHGGTPGQINVMVNGQCVKFTDAAPEITGGRTMVPVRALVEALGGEADYQDGTILFTLDGYQYSFTVGSTTVTVAPTADNTADVPKPDDIVMDCAPYVTAGGRAYVPIRFISEALGYEVGWDDEFRTAIMIDKDALAAQIDRDFTIYNKLLAKNALTEQAQQSTGSAQADVTLFDTLNGDKTGSATYSYDLIASKAGASGKMEYDFSTLWQIIKGYIPMPLDEAGAGEFAETMALMDSLMQGSLDIRMDLGKGKIYFSMPELFKAMGSYLEESGVQIPEGAWLSMSLDGLGLEELTAQLGQAPTVGSMLCTGVYTSDVRSYDRLLEAAAQMAKLFGDGKFTRSGETNVLKLTRDDLAELMGLDSTDEALESISKFEYALTVYDNGDMDAEVTCTMALNSSGINLGDMVQLTEKSTTRDGKTESSMEMHIKNVLKMTITLEGTLTETDKSPDLTPPEDALVLPIDGTLPDGPITSFNGRTQIYL